jgi:hypothetical protein
MNKNKLVKIILLTTTLLLYLFVFTSCEQNGEETLATSQPNNNLATPEIHVTRVPRGEDAAINFLKAWKNEELV